MTKEVMISLLNRCNTGNDMLAVLDTLVEDMSAEDDTIYLPILDQNVPTLETIAF